jgi:hypothetical protein
MPKLYLIPQTEDEKPLELGAGTMQRRKSSAVGKGEDDKERLNNIADLDLEDNKNNNSNNNESETEGLLNSMNSLITGNKKMKEDYMNEFKKKMEKNQRNRNNNNINNNQNSMDISSASSFKGSLEDVEELAEDKLLESWEKETEEKKRKTA